MAGSMQQNRAACSLAPQRDSPPRAARLTMPNVHEHPRARTHPPTPPLPPGRNSCPAHPPGASPAAWPSAGEPPQPANRVQCTSLPHGRVLCSTVALEPCPPTPGNESSARRQDHMHAAIRLFPTTLNTAGTSSHQYRHGRPVLGNQGHCATGLHHHHDQACRWHG